MVTNSSAATDGFTFHVDDVEPGEYRHETMKMHRRVTYVLDRQIESCHDYHSDVCADLNFHPLVAAVYSAYCKHLPLTLTPDAVWLTLAQGVAHHMAIHGERLRSRFVKHAGKLSLEVKVDGWVRNSPENRWSEAFEGWTDQIREFVGAELHDNLLCNFSTSDKTCQLASRIVMLDIFQTYFALELVGVCGIPTVTLRGSVDDWRLLAAKVRGLRCFDMDWWLDVLEPLIDEMAAARDGNANVEHWKRICKYKEQYAGDIINGWIAYFFPYLKEDEYGPCTRLNPIFETGEGFRTSVAPTGLSKVPFVWKQDGWEALMNAFGGLTGVRQDPNTLGLEAVAGWAICDAPAADSLFFRVKSHIAQESTSSSSNHVEVIGDIQEYFTPDIDQFFIEIGACTITQNGSKEAVDFLVPQYSDVLDWGEAVEPGESKRGPYDRTWVRFAKLSGGEFLAINLDPFPPSDAFEKDPRYRRRRYGLKRAPICVCSESTIGKQDINPVVALSFTELLEGLLDTSVDSGYFWTQPDFKPFCDAHMVTHVEKILVRRRRDSGRSVYKRTK